VPARHRIKKKCGRLPAPDVRPRTTLARMGVERAETQAPTFRTFRTATVRERRLQ
jgi:hypothetical protein